MSVCFQHKVSTPKKKKIVIVEKVQRVRVVREGFKNKNKNLWNIRLAAKGKLVHSPTAKGLQNECHSLERL